jgi:DNA invertase Pin-like site-specific DNA recombinase
VTTKLVVPPLPRYVELIRVSSAGQAERDTPADQRRALQRLAQARPGVLVECIEDGAAGLSGAKGFADRPDLQRLAALARAREFDELRVRHVDRLTRHLDMRERAAIYGMVADAGACIVTADNHVIDPTNEIGEVDYFLQTWTSAREKKRILERTREGRRRKLAAGEIIACSPWGRTWNKTTKTWTVDERAMALYRRIFSEVLSDHGRAPRGRAEREGRGHAARWEVERARHLRPHPLGGRGREAHAGRGDHRMPSGRGRGDVARGS